MTSSDRAYVGTLAKALAGQLTLAPDEPEPVRVECSNPECGYGYVKVDPGAHPGEPNFGRIRPCPVCREPGIEQKALARALRNASIPSAFIGATFASYKAIPGADAEACDWVEAWVTGALASEAAPGSILLAGAIGTGKTGCGAVAFATLMRDRYRIAAFARTVDVFAELGRAMDASKRGDDEAVQVSDIVDRLSDAELLMLDDVGAEKATDYREEKLYQILGRRHDYRRTTIITTNKELTELERQVGPRTYSRLIEMCAPNVIRFECEDLRIGQAFARMART